MQEKLGGFCETIAPGLHLRHDHRSQFMSADFQAELLRFLGLECPAFLREREGNGCIQRSLRVLKYSFLGGRHLGATGKLVDALLLIRQRQNGHWLINQPELQSSQ